jgi:hypothetical protein
LYPALVEIVWRYGNLAIRKALDLETNAAIQGKGKDSREEDYPTLLYLNGLVHVEQVTPRRQTKSSEVIEIRHIPTPATPQTGMLMPHIRGFPPRHGLFARANRNVVIEIHIVGSGSHVTFAYILPLHFDFSHQYDAFML